MYQDLFKSVETKSLDSISELKDEISSISYEYEEVPTRSLKLTDKGELSYNSSSLPITLEGITRLITRGFKIPNPFINRIPFDLLQLNIERLGTEIDSSTILVMHDGIIINGIIGEFTPIPTAPLLDSFNEDDYEINKIEFSHLGTTIQSISNKINLNIEPKEGDITRVGHNFITSETGFADPKINSLLYTLVCQNGAILPKNFGQAKIKLNNRDIDSNALTLTFRNKIENSVKKTHELKDRLEAMPNLPITIGKFNSILRNASKVTDSETILSRFELTSEDYTELKVKSKDEEYKYEDTDFSHYKVYSELTNLANDYQSYTRKKLQTLAGKMLNDIRLN